MDSMIEGKRKRRPMVWLIGLLSTACLFYQFPPSFIEIAGCTDEEMYNYNRRANVDDESCVPKVLGCTWPNASNFDANANTMKNYTCVLIDSTACRNYSRPIRVDLEEYAEVKLAFVQYCHEVEWDTLYHSGARAWFVRKTLVLPDTSFYNSLEDAYAMVPADTDFDVKVIEKIPGFDTREYRINADLYGGGYLINPRSFQKYTIEKHVYGSPLQSVSLRPMTFSTTGFLIETRHNIDWWFQEAPAQITVETTYGRNLRGYERYNIMRD